MRQATLGLGSLGFAAAPAPLAPVSVRFRLSSCLIWTVESPPSIGGVDALLDAAGRSDWGKGGGL